MKIASVDALAPQLVYVEKGIAPVLLAQSVYQWGYVGVNTIVDKLHARRTCRPSSRWSSSASRRTTSATGRGSSRRGGSPTFPRRTSRCRPPTPSLRVTEPAVRFEQITRRFPGVQALTDVSLEIAAGSCHALCGENGAGKSTLGKILAGIHTPDARPASSSHGREVHFASPRDALAAGVGMVHQELAFCDNLSVAENLCLGALPSRAGCWIARRDGRARDGDARRDRNDARRVARRSAR